MRKLIFAAFLLFAFHLHAQDGQSCQVIFSGQVIDKHDNTPVPAARIQIRELNVTVVADSNGFFRFQGLCMGTYTFNCLHHIGCEPVKFQRDIHESTFEKIYIEFHFEDLEEVNITQRVFEMSTISVDKPSELDRNYAAGKTLGDLVKQIPGVSTLNTGSSISKPVIHGMHSNRVLIMNNGIRQEGQQWGSEHAPEIDPFLSSEVSLIKGASAVRYGSDAIAGVIMLAPKALKYQPGLRGQVYSTAFTNGRQGSISAILEGGFEKIKNFSWRAQGTFRQGGALQAPRYYMKNTAMKEYNFSWTGKYENTRWGTEVFYSQFNTDLGIFSGAHIGNLTDLNKAFQADRPLEEGSFTYVIGKPKQHIEHELFKVVSHWNVNEKNRLSIQYGRQYNLRKEYDRHTAYNDSIAALNLPAFQLILVTHSADLKWEHQWLKKVKGEAGVSWMRQGNSYEGRFFIPNFRKQSLGAYLIEVLKLDKYEVEVGIRADRSDMEVFIYEAKVLNNYTHTFNQVSGSAGVSRLIGHHWAFRANAGTAWRPPSINEMYSNGLHHGAAAIEVGNRTIRQEVSYNVQAGFTYKSRLLTMQADGYHNQLNGFIYLRPTLPPALTIKGAFPVFRYEQVNARFSGMDLFVNYKLKPYLHLTLKGAIVRAFNQSEKTFMVGIPADRAEPGITYLKEFSKARKLVCNISVPLVRTQDRVETNSDYVAPPKGYVLVNAQISYTFLIRKQNIDLSLEFNNLLNQSYRDYMNRFRYFADETGRNIGLKIKVPFNIHTNEKN